MWQCRIATLGIPCLLALLGSHSGLAASYFTDVPEALTEGNAEIVITRPDSTSIRMVGFANGFDSQAGTYGMGSFRLEEPAKVSVTGTAQITLSPEITRHSEIDTRVTHEPGFIVDLIFHTSAPGTYSVDESDVLRAGDYRYYLNAYGRGAPSDRVEFDILVTIPQPSTSLLLGIGLLFLGMLRRTDDGQIPHP